VLPCFKSSPFDTIKDFEPISTLGYFDIGLFVNQSSPYKNLQELMLAAKSNPGKLNFASINIGSTQNLATELFQKFSKS
jgi:tripartite-type tricarboxylate transporter receptor subunit TctC